MMHIVQRRQRDDGEATIGSWVIDGEWACDTLEDQWQAIKVPGETRIPAGLYELELKPLDTSRFDETATQMLGDDHHGMLRLKPANDKFVFDFTEVLAHWGNFETDTAGCVLVGMGVATDRHGHLKILDSKNTYKKVYPPIAAALLAGERVTLLVVDDDREGIAA